MDAADPLKLPKYQALLDFGKGLYRGFCLHTQELADAVARTQTGLLILADGVQYDIQNGHAANPQPYPSRTDRRFVWTPYV